MPSPYHRAKSPITFEIPELRDELLFAQRSLYGLCQLENERDQAGAGRSQLNLMRLMGKLFPENLHDLVEDVHHACDWAMRKESPPERIALSAILFAGTLLLHKEVAAAVPLLKKLEGKLEHNRELKALWAVNYGIALEKLLGESQADLWETAIQEMPLHRWMRYPSLADGTRNYIRRLRLQHEENSDLQSLLAAAPLAERAYASLTHSSVKGSAFESSGPAVRLLVEIARLQQAVSEDGLGALTAPAPLNILELAAINASVNRIEEDLFVRTLTAIADYHSSRGEREKARETALRALVECGTLKKQQPTLLQTIRTIFEANQ